MMGGKDKGAAERVHNKEKTVVNTFKKRSRKERWKSGD